VFPGVFFGGGGLADPFWLRNIITEPHILAHKNIECVDDRYPKLKIYITSLTLDSLQTHSSSTRNNALHDFTLIKMISARLMGTGSLLIAYSNGYTK